MVQKGVQLGVFDPGDPGDQQYLLDLLRRRDESAGAGPAVDQTGLLQPLERFGHRTLADLKAPHQLNHRKELLVRTIFAAFDQPGQFSGQYFALGAAVFRHDAPPC